jgi:hypothetical protein
MTSQTTEVIGKLREPFPRELWRTRRGPGGTPLTYVEGAEYIKRLLDVLGADWSFEIVEHHVLDDEVVVLGRLRALDEVHMQFGGASIKRSNQSGDALCLADDLKSAATDAFKKCCSSIGVGLHLYSEDTPSDGSPSSSSSSSAPEATPKTRGRGDSRGGDTLTERQRGAIHAIGRGLGLTNVQLEAKIRSAMGVPIDELTRKQASDVISTLQTESAQSA